MSVICQKGDRLTEKEENWLKRNGNLGLFSEALAKESLRSEALPSEGGISGFPIVIGTLQVRLRSR